MLVIKIDKANSTEMCSQFSVLMMRMMKAVRYYMYIQVIWVMYWETVETRSSLTDLSLLIASNARWSCICYLIPRKHLMNFTLKHWSTLPYTSSSILLEYWEACGTYRHSRTYQKNAKLYILKIWPKWTSRYFSKSICYLSGITKDILRQCKRKRYYPSQCCFVTLRILYAR